jgi:3-oxoacyl-[acyl-carrier-protein] synthase II
MGAKERVVVSGMAVASNIGTNIDTFWSNLQKGHTNISYLEFELVNKCRTRIGGKVPTDDIELMKSTIEPLLRNLYFKFDKYKETFYSLYCIGQIIKEGNLNASCYSDFGLIVGSGCGCMNSIEEDYVDFLLHKEINPMSILEGMNNFITGTISIIFGIKGPSFILSSACSSAANAIGLAFKLISAGILDGCFCGGVDCCFRDIFFMGWDKLRVMTKDNDNPTKAMRPFSKNRNGFVLAEGAGYLLLVKESIAQKNKLPIYGEIIGYASTSDATHITRPNVDEQANCIAKALNDAGIDITDVDYINAHGTSTKLNDIAETQAIKRVFGNRAYDIPINSTKSMVGHTLGASGAIETIAAFLCMNKGIIHPTINYDEPDEECDLFYVPNKYIEKNMEIFLKNSFGFGGSNVCLVGKKHRKE